MDNEIWVFKLVFPANLENWIFVRNLFLKPFFWIEPIKALHVAIVYEHKEIIEMLINHKEINLRLQNYDGLTPFACSLRVKNTKAAEHILEKEPTTAEQFDKWVGEFAWADLIKNI